MRTPKAILLAVLFLSMLSGCQKSIDAADPAISTPGQTQQPQSSGWTEHLIVKGSHSSTKNPYKPTTVTEMKFVVKFDNSAIYKNVDTNNQRDINKLYGFADNNTDHHTNSARIGWRWYHNQLQLFAYVYNAKVQTDKFIAAVPLNQDINCSIRAEGTTYVFKVNNTTVSMHRASTTTQAIGYQLYPYFGGDEKAPQDIRISIKDL